MNTIAKKMKAGIDRFLTEMGPFWKKEPISQLFGNLESSEFKTAMRELEKDGVINLIGNDECFFIISEEYLKKELPKEYLSAALKQVSELKDKYC